METRSSGREDRSATNETQTTNPTSAAFPFRSPSIRPRTRLQIRTSSSLSFDTEVTQSRLPSSDTNTPLRANSRTDRLLLSSCTTSVTEGRAEAALASATRSSHRRSSCSSKRPITPLKRSRSSSRRGLADRIPASGQPNETIHTNHSRVLRSRSALIGDPIPSDSTSSRPAKRSRSAQCKQRLSKASSNRSRGSFSRRSTVVMSSAQGADEENGFNQDAAEPSSAGSDTLGSNALQGLLRRLGADAFSRSAGATQSRLQQLRSALVSPEMGERRVEALSEICEFLSVGSDETLISFAVTLFALPLVSLLRTGMNVEVKIYAARALTHMMEALPSSSATIAYHGGAEPLCQNLLSIEYIDLAEQSLSALHKLSVDHPQQIVSANGFEAVLSYIDFFSLGMQRVAAATACNLCRLPQNHSVDLIGGMSAKMMSLLDSEDQRILESAILGFMRLAESFRGVPDSLKVLCGQHMELIEKVLCFIISSSPPSLTAQSHACILRLLTILSRGNAGLGIRILSTKPLIRKIGSRFTWSLKLQSVDCLELIESLLPDPCDTGHGRTVASVLALSKRLCSQETFASIETAKRNILRTNTEPLQFLGQTLFSTLLTFYVSSADSSARRLALSTITKFISIAPQSILADVIVGDSGTSTVMGNAGAKGRFCTFVVGLLRENSASVGLAIAESVLFKLPSLRVPFVREGVMSEVARLAAMSVREGDSEGTHARTGKYSQRLVNDAVGMKTHRSGDLNPPEQVGEGSQAGFFGTSMEVTTTESGDLAKEGIDSSGAPEDDSEYMNYESEVFISHQAHSLLISHLAALSMGSIDEALKDITMVGPLTKLARMLCATKSSDEARRVKALSEVVRLLTNPDGLTVFEISKSGIIEALAGYLAPGERSLRSRRVAAFFTCLNDSRRKGAFARLVGLALGVLESSEDLVVRSWDSSNSNIAAVVTSGLRLLAQPLKLRLRKSNDSANEHLRDYSHHVILIEPLATLTSIEKFLWPRVYAKRASTSSGSQRRATEATDGEVRSSLDERQHATLLKARSRGPHRATSTTETGEGQRADGSGIPSGNRGAMSTDRHGGPNSYTSDEDASSGEEEIVEHGVNSSAGQERDGIDGFNVDRMNTTLPAFEIDHKTLGQDSRSYSRSHDEPQRHVTQAIGSTTSRTEALYGSYAAALAGNASQSRDYSLDFSDVVANQGIYGPEKVEHFVEADAPATPRLFFSLNGELVSRSSSILAAVAELDPENLPVNKDIWSDVHTLVYSTASTSGVTDVAMKCAKRSTHMDPVDAAISRNTPGPIRRSRRLLENQLRNRPGLQRKRRLSSGSDHEIPEILLSDETEPKSRELSHSLPASLVSIIELLRHLHWIQERSEGRLRSVTDRMETLFPGDPAVQFQSLKLSAKLARQVSDPVAVCSGMIPSWVFSLSRDATFLIPFDTRRIVFQSTSLGIARALHLLQTRVDASMASHHQGSRANESTETRIGRIQRQKVRVHRNRILESAIRAMTMYATHATVLEFEYFDEAGTGLGPTLEFYTLASREAQQADLGLWRDGSSSCHLNTQRDYIHTRQGRSARREKEDLQGCSSQGQITAYVTPTGDGLFPSCLPIIRDGNRPGELIRSTSLYEFIGRLVGKGILDNRLLDLRFSRTFSRLVLAFCRVFNEKLRHSNCITNVSSITDEGKRQSLPELDELDRERVWQEFSNGIPVMMLLEDVDHQLATSLSRIITLIRTNQRETIESMCLTFVLPGNDAIELVENGKDREVTRSNAEEFVQRVVYHVLFGGVARQTEALVRGLGEVLDVTSLLSFRHDELDLLICGPSFEKWTLEFLVQATRCDHGYSHDSAAVRFCLTILSEMKEVDQQHFVLFATGSPALPVGGLKNLSPRLTIVRRNPEEGRSPDECLPTVMTCTNYLKLPEYTSLEIARKQIMYAVREGQGSFHLS